jgi:hypothetical protein
LLYQLSYAPIRLIIRVGELELETPRDRKATFDPKIVAKGQTHWTGFDDKIISIYARGMTTREIQGHQEEMYHIEVSPTLISNVTEAVIEEVKQWQRRPLQFAVGGLQIRYILPLPYDTRNPVTNPRIEPPLRMGSIFTPKSARPFTSSMAGWITRCKRFGTRSNFPTGTHHTT